MRKDKRSPEEKVADQAGLIKLTFRRWREVKRQGAGDPNWPDGTNLNLLRNHILNDQRILLDLCKENPKLKCPKEARLKAPREYSNEYLVRRRKRVRGR